MLETFSKTLPNGIFVRQWKKENPIGVIVAVHGMGTHSGRFDKIAQAMGLEGFTSFCYDQPVHGNSPGKRGHIDTYDQLLNTLEGVIEYAKNEFPGLPVFLFGHSMGGNVVLNYVIRRKPDLTGVVVSSPWLKLAFDPPFFKMLLAKAVVHIFPSLRQKSTLNLNYISHDPEVLKRYDEDELIHSYITPAFFIEVSKAGLYALENKHQFSLPLYLFHGTEDHLTSFDASKKFAHGLAVCKFQAWEGCYHEVHNEWVANGLMANQAAFMKALIS